MNALGIITKVLSLQCKMRGKLMKAYTVFWISNSFNHNMIGYHRDLKKIAMNRIKMYGIKFFSKKMQPQVKLVKAKMSSNTSFGYSGEVL